MIRFHSLPLLKFLLLIVVFALLMSCDKNRLFEKNKEIKNEIWNKSEVIRFEVPVTDTIFRYNFYINIRNSTDYNYSNIYLFVNTIYPNRSMSRDTVECVFADQNGKWLGKGMGDMKSNQILFKKGLRFPKAGLYTFEFEQAMRVDNLKGIHDIGLRIERLK